MDKRVNDIRLEQWKQIINEQIASGMTIRGWCKQNDIKQRQFHYWKKKLIDHTLDDIPFGSSSEKSLPSTQSMPRPAPAEPSLIFTELKEPVSSVQSCQDPGTLHVPAGILIRCGAFTVVADEAVNESCLEKVLRVISHV